MGRAVAEALLAEGARVIANARRAEALYELQQAFPGVVDVVAGDVRLSETQDSILECIADAPLAGVFVNAGGPPAKGFLETVITDWDNAYSDLLRWKVDLVQRLLPGFIKYGYGRILFLESVSVKQAIPNLVLSNSLRMAVVGMAKTLSDEVADKQITVNVLAPGYHSTPAVDRVMKKAAGIRNMSIEDVTADLVGAIPLKRMGKASELASLATWLLSPESAYITGQTITVDGGRVRGNFG